MRLIALLVFLCMSSAYPQDKPKPAQKARTEQRGTENNPLAVKLLPDQNADAEAAKRERHAEEQSTQERRVADATVALAWVTFALAVFTGALWLANLRLSTDAKRTSDRQAGETQRALQISEDAAKAAQESANAAAKTAATMKDTAERQLRAYVSVETHPPTDINGRRMEGKFGILIKNRGQTPAHKVRSWMAIRVREYPLEGELASNVSIGSVTVLSPGEEQVGIKDFPKVAEEDAKAIVDGKKAVYIFGEVVYEDVFGKERRTRFRLFQSGEGVSHQRLANYHEGNEAD